MALSELRSSALETLLDSEKMLGLCHREETVLSQAPEPARVPGNYVTLLPHEERKLQTKLNLWDSFQTASGIVPSIARFAVAAVIVAGAVWMTLPL